MGGVAILLGVFAIYYDWMSGVTEVDPSTHIVRKTDVTVGLQIICTGPLSCHNSEGDLFKTGDLAVDLIIAAVCYVGLLIILILVETCCAKKCGHCFMLVQVIHRFFGVLLAVTLMLVAFLKEKPALDKYAEDIAMDGVKYESGFTCCIVSIILTALIALCNSGELLLLCMTGKRNSGQVVEPLIGNPTSV